MRQTEAKKKEFEDYERTKKTYDVEVKEFDAEVTKEKDREKDIFKATFEAKVVIR